VLQAGAFDNPGILTNPHEHPMLQGKTALVTGSTSGIGLGMALTLARHGAKVMLNGFGDVDGAVAQVKALGGAVAYHGADMRDPAQIEAMVRACTEQLGGPDILINNAGIQHVAQVEDFPVERWDAIIAINLSSAFHAMRVALPGMKARGWGRVINIASAHGLVASAGKSAYVAALHGIVGLTKAAALECATSGVTVNAICPGWVLTPLVQKQIDDRAAAGGISVEQAQRNLLAEKEPSLRFTTPEQLAELAVFMCSPAGDNVLGVAWNMDGGWLAQ
jgi:3-hydroxybutyrate dehydrogenase